MKQGRTRTRRAGGRKAGLVALGCLVCLLVVAAPAAADSIVYVKGSNVWLADADGSGQYQVTEDGTAEHPYRSPSQADDGTIAVGFGNEIVRLKQNGTVLNRIDPPAILDSASSPVDGPPIDVAISPDGSRIAYTMSSYTCPIAADCGGRTVTAYTAADHLTAPQLGGTTFLRDPSWATSSRTLQFGGYTHQVNVHDVGAAGDVHWFDDYDVVGQADATDLGDGELNRQGTRLALVRDYGSSATVAWYDVSGNVLTGLPAAPAMRCVTSADEGINGPTWSPDGESLAMADPEGIWVKRDAGNCGAPAPQLIIPGGSYPDWGPAPVNPGPRGSQQGPSAAGPVAAPASTPAPAPVPVAGKAGETAPGGKCATGTKAQRAKCLAAGRRARALRKCKRKHGKAHARCVRAAKKGGK
jgi:hypothetical protein